MKLSKKKEKELMLVYEAYWDYYLKGDAKAMQHLLDESYTQVGSAESEVFSTKKDAVQFLFDTIDQVAGKLEMRNRHTKVESQDNLVLIHELCDLYALADKEWIFYSKFRASTLLQEKKEGWKITHQHSSFPDTKTEEGQNVAIDLIAEENLQLREAVKRRTVELEQKNRELQIEVALDKVRSRTMAMRNSEELAELSLELVKQVQALGVATWFCAFNIYDDDPKGSLEWGSNGQGTFPKYRTPREGIFNRYYEAGQGGETLLINEINENECPAHYDYLCTLPGVGEQLLGMKDAGIPFPKSQIDHVAFFKYGYVLFITYEPTPESHDVFKRFAKVFEQTYTRFLDLQKAEAQAREAQIEAALEKVRSRTMAMHKSEELPEAANNLFLQVQELGIPAWSAGYCIWESEDKKSASCNMSSEGELQKSFSLPTIGEGYNFYDPFKRGDTFYVEELGGEKLVKHYEFMLTLPTVGEIFDELLKAGLSLPTFQIFHIVYFPHGYLMFITYEPVSDAHAIFKRFASVFEQTYTRFLDLQKAEAQAREAQIEAALEKVRSRTMAMHKSEELAETALVLYEQFSVLGNIPDRMSIGIFKDETKIIELWSTDQSGSQLNQKFTGSFEKSAEYTKIYEAWKAGNDSFVLDLKGQKLKNWLKFIRGELKLFVDDSHIKGRRLQQAAFFSQGMLLFTTNEPIAAEIMQLLIRFARVFSQTYTRFLDLQKAEFQAREAQIETALERVRSKTMAMHNSDDVAGTVITLFDEVIKLGLDQSIRCGIGILEGTEHMETWSATFASKGKVDLKMGMLNMEAHPILKAVKKAWKSGKTGYACEYKGKEVTTYYTALNNEPNYPFYVELSTLPDKMYTKSFCFSEGILFAHTENPISEEATDVLKRFTAVFGQTYRRYLDLLKAEAQTREAQIEGALERVRSKTMAMHTSGDLENIVISLFDEVMKLGLDKSLRCGIGILEDHEGMETRSVNFNSDGTMELRVGMLNMTIHPMLVGLKKAWQNGSKDYSYYYTAKDVRTYYEALNNEPEYPFNANLETLPEQEFHQSFFYSSGIIFAFSKNPISEESSKILARFAAVFGQTYRRFLDLKKAELQAKDAIKQASLDRVRGEIASMRATEDLQRITPLVFNELTILGVPFFRCGVFIVHEKEKNLEVYLSAPDGHSLGVLHLPFNVNKLTQNSVENWKINKVYHQHWNKEEFVAWTQSMVERGQIQDLTTYQGAAEPPDSLDLHFIPFAQGMLYVGHTEQLREDHIDLVRSLAESFSIAYARYEDFVNLDKAKASIEATLTELKATQNQLVQSEKMASLGELTAGIAHEIQNPLNFVNNFSEVSMELLEEMMEEMQKGDEEEVKALAEDVIQNLEKIYHHGQRADGIVKGMLQHSRTSSGEKELTDINVLTDEYLRLAYHGLRAKDKSFNATTKTDFDENIGKINIIPQDIGRVILNLITNAFYAVNEKSSSAKASGDTKYEPTVSVSTKKVGNKVEIKVLDNGNGIPNKALEKIFQPFFTTKPTGQGTGLGLSLSYDIVKAHGGELTVETKENEGSTFNIYLPL